ncbi:MAG: hypothetical protein KDC85_21610 [Saprospiraceae bacterium]|nr:hypothetical protein [Saprospiraceae bacterium]MCB9324367.1 hypothetical protein [Lewinellaceae bacterium]
MLKVFGIRHHGPGSARSLVKALEAMQPDCILIEGPADAQPAISYATDGLLEPPVALLVYQPDDLKKASYFPFAHYSPEWQAIQYGHQHDIEVRFIDLPMALQFTLDAEEAEIRQTSLAGQLEDQTQKPIIHDPLGYIASIAGYKDSERWWDTVFETTDGTTDTFEAVNELISTLRQELGRQESPRTLLREAFMRKMIRQTEKESFEKIAVVCGAWHMPALLNLSLFKASADNDLLKGIKRTKSSVSWIPWSYEQLANQNGYGAGVVSPAWYALLFDQQQDVVAHWMARVSQLFRKEGFDASPAHVLEAVRLSKTLAAMRKKPLPTLEEMEEAALSVFCRGEVVQLNIIRKALVIGERVGKVSENIPMIPFQKDLLALVKTARLTKYWEQPTEEWLKSTKDKPKGGIDLREEADLLKSHLLHRLNILGIPWGQQQHFSDNDLGSFKEYWKLKWHPGFSLRIIEAGMWGNSVKSAASMFLIKNAREEERLSTLTVHVKAALDAGLHEIIDELLQKMQQLAAQTHQILSLMDSLPSLVWIVQYGDVRQTDIPAVSDLINELIPRICIGLPGLCVNIDEEVTEEIFREVIRTHRAITALDNEDHNDQWQKTLMAIASSMVSEEKLRGACTRILFDKSVLDPERTGKLMQFAISGGNSVQSIARWVEGFLYGSGLLLVHHPALWKLIDDWISGLSPDHFNEVVPLLRRSFANFSESERTKMMTLAQKPEDSPIFAGLSEEMEFDKKREAVVLPAVKRILGI